MKKKSRIKWHCRRGMLELDLFFMKFLDKHLDKMSDAECDKFEEFLKTPDPVLYSWFMGQSEPSDKESANFVAEIRSSNKS